MGGGLRGRVPLLRSARGNDARNIHIGWNLGSGDSPRRRHRPVLAKCSPRKTLAPGINEPRSIEQGDGSRSDDAGNGQEYLAVAPPDQQTETSDPRRASRVADAHASYPSADRGAG